MGGIVGWFRGGRIRGRRRCDAAVLLVWFAAAVLECVAFASGLSAVVVIAVATVVIEVVIRRRRRRRDGADKLVARLIGGALSDEALQDVQADWARQFRQK